MRLAPALCVLVLTAACSGTSGHRAPSQDAFADGTCRLEQASRIFQRLFAKELGNFAGCAACYCLFNRAGEDARG